MFGVREGIHQCDSQHTPATQDGRCDPPAPRSIVALAELAVELVERGVRTARRPQPPEAQDVRLGQVKTWWPMYIGCVR
jgi:hypothetical protein